MSIREAMMKYGTGRLRKEKRMQEKDNENENYNRRKSLCNMNREE